MRACLPLHADERCTVRLWEAHASGPVRARGSCATHHASSASQRLSAVPRRGYHVSWPPMMTPFFYFVLSVFLLVNVLGVLQPRIFGQTLGLIGSIPFLLVSLMAPQLIVLSLFVTLLVNWMGGLATPLGQLGLVVNGACWCLLLLHLLLMRNALPVLDGKPIRDDEPVFPGQPAGPLQVSVLPHLTRRAHARRKVEILRNITYRTIDGQRLQLDVYRPRHRAAGANTKESSAQLQSLIYIHGGAWTMGSPISHRRLTAKFSEVANAAVLAIDYTLAPEKQFPAIRDQWEKGVDLFKFEKRLVKHVKMPVAGKQKRKKIIKIKKVRKVKL